MTVTSLHYLKQFYSQPEIFQSVTTKLTTVEGGLRDLECQHSTVMLVKLVPRAEEIYHNFSNFCPEQNGNTKDGCDASNGDHFTSLECFQ